MIFPLRQLVAFGLLRKSEIKSYNYIYGNTHPDKNYNLKQCTNVKCARNMALYTTKLFLTLPFKNIDIYTTKLFLTLPFKNIDIHIGSATFYILFYFNIDLFYDLHLDHYASFHNVLTDEGI